MIIQTFSVNPPPPPPLPPLIYLRSHTIMDMTNNKQRNVLTHARVNFSQSQKSSLPREGRREVKILVTTGASVCVCVWGGGGGREVNRKNPLVQLFFVQGKAEPSFKEHWLWADLTRSGEFDKAT